MTDRGFPIDTIRYDERMALLPRGAGRCAGRLDGTAGVSAAAPRRADRRGRAGKFRGHASPYRPNSRVIASIPSGVSGNIRRSINCRVIAIDCV